MTIRRYRDGDAEPIADLFGRSVRAIGPRGYSPEQIEAWANGGFTAERLAAAQTNGRITLVAVDDQDRPIAFGDLEPDGHIDFLYAAPEAAGRGVVAGLYAELEALARAAAMPRLYSEASEAARRFFLKQGFTVLHRRDFEVRGVPIHNYAVEKILV